jgi:hypothetical protein
LLYIDHEQINYEEWWGGAWMKLAQDCVQRQALALAVLNLKGSALQGWLVLYLDDVPLL